MSQIINEPIEVLAAFRNLRAEPILFKWGGRYYRIKTVNLLHVERKGREKNYIFSVSDQANAFRLRFSSETLAWKLEAMEIKS